MRRSLPEGTRLPALVVDCCCNIAVTLICPLKRGAHHQRRFTRLIIRRLPVWFSRSLLGIARPTIAVPVSARTGATQCGSDRPVRPRLNDLCDEACLFPSFLMIPQLFSFAPCPFFPPFPFASFPLPEPR